MSQTYLRQLKMLQTLSEARPDRVYSLSSEAHTQKGSLESFGDKTPREMIAQWTESGLYIF